MKRSLLSVSWLVFLLYTTDLSYSQTVILSEDFSGFTTGSHSTPSTNDVSLSLDTRTFIPGWRGNLIYSAGGEIKIGTGSATDWIETPLLDLSLNDGNCKVSFDIARWPNYASTVQVYIDGNSIGTVITPSDNFTNTEIDITSGTSSSRIRIQGLTKRFFIDNLIIKTGIPTTVSDFRIVGETIKFWPVPAEDELFIEGAGSFDEVSIIGLSGTIYKRAITKGINNLTIDVTGVKPGFYILILNSNGKRKTLKFIKH